MYWHVHSTCISDQTVSVIRYAISAYKCCHISSRHVWHGVISSNGQLIMHKRNHIYRYLWSNCKNLTHRLAWLIFQTSTMSNLSVHEYLEIQVWNYIYCVTMSICAQLATTVMLWNMCLCLEHVGNRRKKLRRLIFVLQNLILWDST